MGTFHIFQFKIKIVQHSGNVFMQLINSFVKKLKKKTPQVCISIMTLLKSVNERPPPNFFSVVIRASNGAN